MARRDGMQTVELVDGAPEPAHDDPPAPPTSRRRWLVAAVAAVAVVAAAVQGVVSYRERAELARLATVPGVLAPFDGTLDVVRPVRGDESRWLFETAAARFALGEDGSQTVRWFAADSDDPVWTAQLAGPDARLTSTDEVAAATTCTFDARPGTDPSSARRYVCLVSDGATYYDGVSEGRTVPATTTSLVVLSTADGSELARWPLDRGEALAVLPGDLVVVGAAVDDDTAVATGYDLLSGAQRWTSEQQHVTRRPDEQEHVQVEPAGDLVAFGPTFGSLALLDPASGAVVRADLLDGVASGFGSWAVLPDGVLAVVADAVDGSERTTLVAADGDPDEDLTLDGSMMWWSVDDESLADLLLTVDRGTVRAWDAATGSARWKAVVGSVTTVLVLRGRVYVGIQGGVVALDGRTGEEQWHADRAAGTQPGTVLTDGRHLLLPLEGAEGGSVLAAYDLVDGHEVFRSPYPAGVDQVWAAGRTLIGFDDAGDVMVLG
jgi:outer membrane protein assembly factor BamB